MVNKIITFLYHEVTDYPFIDGFQRPGAMPYKHTVEHFLSDLNIIQNNIKNSVLVNQLKDTSLDQLMLTFDDGGSSALNIAEILSSRGLHGHFFITTSKIDKEHFLSRNDILSIHKLGHMIGSHSHNHPSIFRDLNYKEMLNEWESSKAILEEILGSKVISASVPGGDMNDETIKSASEAGLEFLFTSEPHYKPYKKYNITIIGRVCPKKNTPSQVINLWSQGRGYLKTKVIRFMKELIRRRLKFIYKIYVRYNEGR